MYNIYHSIPVLTLLSLFNYTLNIQKKWAKVTLLICDDEQSLEYEVLAVHMVGQAVVFLEMFAFC